MLDAYQHVTQRLIEALERDVVPWRKPWDTAQGQPQNLVTRRPYNGINVLLLGLQPYSSPYWLTYRQAEALGGHVKAGEHGTRIVFWKPTEYATGEKDEVGEAVTRRSLLVKTYVVFNHDQTEDVPAPPRPAFTTLPTTPVVRVEDFVRGIQPAPSIRHGGRAAYYQPGPDVVTLPDPESFESYEAYAATRFHELVHWTGHVSRLGRATLAQAGRFGDENYSKEELVAEIGAGFLCATLSLENASTWQNSVSYIHGWLKALRNDKSLIIGAAQNAAKAAAYLSGTTETPASGPTTEATEVPA